MRERESGGRRQVPVHWTCWWSWSPRLDSSRRRVASQWRSISCEEGMRQCQWNNEHSRNKHWRTRVSFDFAREDEDLPDSSFVETGERGREASALQSNRESYQQARFCG